MKEIEHEIELSKNKGKNYKIDAEKVIKRQTNDIAEMKVRLDRAVTSQAEYIKQLKP